jgi:poly-beta-1,6-N-acetyl-D-glucosamine synthase
VALALSAHYDRWDLRSMLVGAVYPVLFWLASASAALHSQVVALVRGPRGKRVVWDIPREQQERAVR